VNRLVRLAGWGSVGILDVTWTVAEGRRGRRWREVVSRDGAIIRSLLLETDVDRRFSHLELSVAGVLLTLHPESDGSLHGNRVADDGSAISHVAGLAFGSGSLLRVEGSLIADVAIAWALVDVVRPGDGETVQAVAIDRRGQVAPRAPLGIQRIDDRTWQIGGGDPFEMDPRGVPSFGDGRIEALEG